MYRPTNIVIVGGGSAGWMTAALLRKSAPPEVSFTLVEASDIPTVGVGEATTNSIRFLWDFLGLDEGELFAAADATFKTGIVFSGWNPQREYFHPFGPAVVAPEVLVRDWAARADAGDRVPFDVRFARRTEQFSARHLSPQTADDPPYRTQFGSYGYQIDAGLLGDLLKRHAKGWGVRQVIDRVIDVTRDERGWITSVVTREHGDITGDLFFDCTGFRSLLIGQTLEEPFVSYADELWCDRAIAVIVPHDRSDAELRPSTKATATEAGWIWDIPLQSRIGAGYVYSSAHQSPEEAERLIRQHYGLRDDVAARHITMRVGRARRAWVHNVVSVGLSGGFIEPLESTGLALISESSEFFAAHAPDLAWNETLRDTFNSELRGLYEYVRDFIAFHYATASRHDSAFWRDYRASGAGRHHRSGEFLAAWLRGEVPQLTTPSGFAPFLAGSWAYIAAGNGCYPDQVAAPTPAEVAAVADPYPGYDERIGRLLTGAPSHRRWCAQLAADFRAGVERRGPGDLKAQAASFINEQSADDAAPAGG